MAAEKYFLHSSIQFQVLILFHRYMALVQRMDQLLSGGVWSIPIGQDWLSPCNRFAASYIFSSKSMGSLIIEGNRPPKLDGIRIRSAYVIRGENSRE
jgi:hypothetical protein